MDRLPKISLWILALLLASFFIFLFFFFVEPISHPQNVFISNVTDSQATVSYTTKNLTRDAVLVSKDGSLPPVPIGDLVKDDGEKDLKKSGFYTTHHITIGNLEPQKKYRFKIFQGLRGVYEGEFSTGDTLDSPSSPNPVYGKVLDSAQKPIAGAIVYFVADDGNEKSALVSTLSNEEGRWSIDLGNLRTKGSSSAFQVTPSTREELVVEAGALGRGKAISVPGQDKPWPDIIIQK